MDLRMCTFLLVIIICITMETDSWRRRRRRRCSPVNCEWGQWSSWSDCTYPCGTDGTQTRTRSKDKDASCGGSSCSGSSTETRSCNVPGCNGNGTPLTNSCECNAGWDGRCCGSCVLINCTLSEWSDWSHCSPPCGLRSEKKRTRTELFSSHCGGSECTEPLEETTPCEDEITCYGRGEPLQIGFGCSCNIGFYGDCCLLTEAEEDPCFNYVPIDEPARSINYHVDSSDPGLICDDNFPWQWYRFVSGAGGEMTNIDDLPNYSCGTEIPLYMDGTHPVGNQTEWRIACGNFLGTRCFTKYPMQVKNCGDYFVYKLGSVECTRAYCAGTELQCKEGQTSPNGFTPGCSDTYPMLVSEPVVSISMEEQNYPELGDVNLMTPIFHCEFTPTTYENVTSLFTINWYADNELVQVENLVIEKGETRNVKLTLDDFDHPSPSVDGLYSIGQTIKCGVVSKFVDEDTISPEKWDSYFAGIKIFDTVVYLEENSEPYSINFSSSIPIVCDRDADYCYTRVGVHTSIENKLIYNIQDCYVELTNDYIVGTIETIDIVCHPNEPAYEAGVYILAFDTFDSSNPSYYVGYAPGEVTVHVNKQHAGQCRATGDPHYTTFDGTYYDWYGVDDYVMVKEKEGFEMFNFTVEVRLKKCNHGNSNNPSCNCAVAVREGNDVAIVDSCDGPMKYYVHRDHVYCNPAFTVSISPNGKEVWVHTGSGQLVRYVDGSYPDVYIDFNGALFERVEGLCGSFDENKNNDLDYIDPATGDVISNNNADDFAKSYELDKGTSLFYKENMPIANPNLPSSYPTCQCLAEDPESPESGSIIVCGSYSDGIKGYDDGTEHFSCEDMHQEVFSSGMPKTYNDDYVVYESIFSHHSSDLSINDFNADSLTWPTPSGITEDEAMRACYDAVHQSNIIEYCEQVESIADDIDNALADCKFDVQAMDDLSATSNARSVVESSCLSVVYKNTSLWVANDEGELAPPESVVGATCPGHCSGHGNCSMEGVCICEEGFTSVDCSIDIGKPPRVYEVYGGNICDIRSRPCARISVAASGIFDSGYLTCHIYELDYISGIGIWTDTGVVATTLADFMSAYQMNCYLPLTYARISLDSRTDPSASPIHAFNISVSNDGVTESSMLPIVVYDSVCVNCSEDGTCVQRAIASTMKTTPSLSTPVTTPGIVGNLTTPRMVGIEPSDTGNSWVWIVIVICVCIAITVVVTVVVWKKVTKKNKVAPAIKLGDVNSTTTVEPTENYK
uniref:von Willebrand factor D and EGF domain-containing protein-like n=1 Tax=Saccoglossus kowalevskii TaxID=10224 RepID=A0ABM0MFS4_SACKO|nr:PREDICTED: von Willebrand factor D and EGF domain-containing protein-like [Saccoglossus kowalevskii]